MGFAVFTTKFACTNAFIHRVVCAIFRETAGGSEEQQEAGSNRAKSNVWSRRFSSCWKRGVRRSVHKTTAFFFFFGSYEQEVNTLLSQGNNAIWVLYRRVIREDIYLFYRDETTKENLTTILKAQLLISWQCVYWIYNKLWQKKKK